MTTYAVAHLNVVDPEKLNAYRSQADAALAKHGGRIAVVAPNPHRLEGGLAAPQSLVLLEFPSAQAAKDWHGDPSLNELHDLRRAGADVSIFVMDAGA